MRPEITTDPPRLFEAELEVTGDQPLSAGEAPTAWAPCTLDLARIHDVRAYYDFEEGAFIDGQSVLTSDTGVYLLRAPYVTVRDAWQAYRTHADALGRLRN